MLHVDRRDHVDARVQDLVDVLVTLLVAHPRGVRVGELVDQRQFRRATDHRVGVHLLQLQGPVLRAQARHDLEPLRERRGLGPVVRLEVADHDVPAFGLRLPALLQHPVGLAYAGGHAEQDPVAATPIHAPKQVVHDQVDQLDPDEGQDHAAEAVDQQVAPQKRRRADRAILDAAQGERDERRDDQRVEDDRGDDRALRRAQVHDVQRVQRASLAGVVA